MWLKEVPSCPTSSPVVTSTRDEKLPAATARVAAFICESGFSTLRVSR